MFRQTAFAFALACFIVSPLASERAPVNSNPPASLARPQCGHHSSQGLTRTADQGRWSATQGDCLDGRGICTGSI